jgi:hypothetical protein
MQVRPALEAVIKKVDNKGRNRGKGRGRASTKRIGKGKGGGGSCGDRPSGAPFNTVLPRGVVFHGTKPQHGIGVDAIVMITGLQIANMQDVWWYFEMALIKILRQKGRCKHTSHHLRSHHLRSHHLRSHHLHVNVTGANSHDDDGSEQGTPPKVRAGSEVAAVCYWAWSLEEA